MESTCVKLKDWMSNSIDHDEPSHLDLCCLQKEIKKQKKKKKKKNKQKKKKKKKKKIKNKRKTLLLSPVAVKELNCNMINLSSN